MGKDIPYINIHSHRSGQEGAITLRSYRLGVNAAEPAPPFSAGIHPWDAAAKDDFGDELRYLSDAPIAAVGEIGLDFSTDIDRERQADIFGRQLEIAVARGLPVVIHCVKAFNEIVLALKAAAKHTALPPVIMHSYTGSPQQTQTAIDAGIYLSLGEVSLHSPKTIESLAAIPPEKLFLETDDKDISIMEMYTLASVAAGVDIAELKSVIYDNYKRVFKHNNS